MDRRGFLKLAAGGTVGLVASPIIWKTLYDAAYWTQNWSWIPRLKPGENTYVSTVSKLDPSGTGIKVRLVDKRAVRTIGDPENPMSKGALTALAASEVQLLYSEARVKKPLKRSDDGVLVGITWEEAHKILLEKHAEAGKNVAFISGDPNGTINEVFSAFISKLGSDDFYLMPSDEMTAYGAWKTVGLPGRPAYDIENSDFILCLDASFLENWGTIARNRRIYDETHDMRMDLPTMTLAYASPIQDNTAAGADIWVPIMPNTKIHLVLGLVNALSSMGQVPLGNIADLRSLLQTYTPERVQELTGLPVDKFRNLLQAISSAKRPLVIAGSALGAGSCSNEFMAGVLLNYTLGRLSEQGNMCGIPNPAKVLADAFDFDKMMSKNLIAYTQSVAASGIIEAPKLLYVYSANPLYSLPGNSGTKELLAKSSFTVALASFMDETAVECDLILPASMGLERFDDVYTPYGSGVENWTMAVPAARSGYDSRPIGELIIALSKELGNDLGVANMPALFSAKATAIGANYAEVSSGKPFIKTTTEKLKGSPNIDRATIEAAAREPISDDIKVIPQYILGMGSATCAIPPFATKIITDYQLKGEYSVAQMSSITAKNLGVANGQKIKLFNDAAKVEVIVSIFEGIMPQTISICTNLGHTAFDQFSKNKGINYINLTSVQTESDAGIPVWTRCGVSVMKG